MSRKGKSESIHGACAVGIDVGGTFIKIAVVDAKAAIIGKTVFETPSAVGVEPVIERVLSGIGDVLSSSGIGKQRVNGIGIGMPGSIDSSAGIVHTLINIEGWDEVPLAEVITRQTGLVCRLDNDTNLMAFGEFLYGAGQGYRNLVCVTLGTGVGSGIILDGRLYRGSDLSAGEIGHITLRPDGPRCNCGNYGCLEVYTGNHGLIRRTRELIDACSGKADTLIACAGGDAFRITPEHISQAVREGDDLAVEIIREFGTNLGIVFAGVVNLLNPEAIIIGGGIAGCGTLLFDTVKQTIKKRSMSVSSRNLKVIPAALGTDAGVIGAAALIFEASP